MVKRFYFLIFIFSLTCSSFAQIGGRSVYHVLDFSYSSRIAALGGGLVSLHDNDPTCITYNPSSISQAHHNTLAFHFTNYFANTGYGSALYSRTFKKAGSFAFEMRYVGYGKFTGTDETGMETGEFTAGDYALTVGWGRQLDERFSIGANLKLIYSGYESYHSFGLAVDVAGSYYSEKKKLSLTLLVKNIGSEIKSFTPNNYQKLPFDIQLAMSQRLTFLPVRYHISLHSLYRWNMTTQSAYLPFYEKDISGTYRYPTKVAQFFDNFFRHIIIGLEIEPIKQLSLQFSYNHNQRQEMKIPQKASMAGFSYGFTIDIHSIRVGFSRSHYAVGAVPNYITFSCNIDELSKLTQEKKKKKLERLN